MYIWDYVNYINKQYNAEAAFLQGPAVGFHFILDSLAEDYTNFNTLFIEFPFCLTRPHWRQLCDLSGVQHRAHAAAFAGRSGSQSGPDAAR